MDLKEQAKAPAEEEGGTGSYVPNPGFASGVAPYERSERPISVGVDIGHVHLRAGDLAKIKAFYVGILGFDVMMEGPTMLSPAARNHRPLPRGDPLSDARRAGRCAAATARRGLPDRWFQRPWHARGDLPARPGGERPGAVLGPAAGRVGSRRAGSLLARQPTARPARFDPRGRDQRDRLALFLLQHDHRDLPGRLLPIVVEARVDRRMVLVKPLVVVIVDDA